MSPTKCAKDYEPISKLFEQDNETGELNQAQEILDNSGLNQGSKLLMNLGKKLPVSSFVSLPFASIDLERSSDCKATRRWRQRGRNRRPIKTILAPFQCAVATPSRCHTE
jgi:hypothetical protein